MNEPITTIGCDLGDKKSTLSTIHSDGREERTQSIPTTRQAFAKWFTRPRCRVVLEAGTHSRWVAELLEELGHEVIVANPRRLRLISQSDNKTDNADAELLARLGRSDPKLLSPIRHRGSEVHNDLAVLKARDALVRTRTELISLCRGMVKSTGFRLRKCTAESFHRSGAIDQVPAGLLPALAPILHLLKHLDRAIRLEDARIEALAKKYPDAEVVSQPVGIGLLTGLAFVLTLEDKHRFRTSRSVGAFLGMCPRKHASGDSDPQMRITKAGDPFLRRLLVQCANYVLGKRCKAHSDLRSWGLQLSERGGKNARKRAKVAVARRMAVLMHRLWMTGEEYDPHRVAKLNEVKAKTA